MQAIDTRYWECKVEIAYETPATDSSGNKSEKNDNNKLSSNTGKGSSQSKQKNNNNSSSGSNKGNSSEPKKTSTPDYASKLGKDGKLTPQERQHRIDKTCVCVVALPATRQVIALKAKLQPMLTPPRLPQPCRSLLQPPSIAAWR